MDGNFGANLDVDQIDFRDMQHIYVAANRPKAIIGEQREENRYDALATAYWGRRAFIDLKRLVQTRPFHSLPITYDGPDLKRFFYDAEYWRVARNIVLPLSIGLISEDGQTKLHGVFQDHVNAFLNHTRSKALNGHEAFIMREVLPKIEADKSAFKGLSAEITQHVIDMIPHCRFLELWSDRDSSDRHALGSMQTAEGWGLFSELRHIKRVGAVLPRELARTYYHLGRPKNMPEQDVETKHVGIGDAEYNRIVFKALQLFARRTGVHADAIIPADFLAAKTAPTVSPMAASFLPRPQ